MRIKPAAARPFFPSCSLIRRAAGLCRPALFCLLAAVPSVASAAERAPGERSFWDTSEDYWTLLFGYGQSFPGWGRTEERVHSFEIAPRYSHLTIGDIGSGWWAGRHDTMIEVPLTVVDGEDFDAGVMVGANLLAAYTFTASDVWQPYIFGGGGILYSSADIPGMGAHWNGNYQFAAGLRRVLADRRALTFEARYHHISNAGTRDPNVPLNGVRFMIGFTF